MKCPDDIDLSFGKQTVFKCRGPREIMLTPVIEVSNERGMFLGRIVPNDKAVVTFLPTKGVVFSRTALAELAEVLDIVFKEFDETLCGEDPDA